MFYNKYKVSSFLKKIFRPMYIVFDADRKSKSINRKKLNLQPTDFYSAEIKIYLDILNQKRPHFLATVYICVWIIFNREFEGGMSVQ